MKFRKRVILSILLVCFALPSPVIAAPAVAAVDPCLGASFVAEMGTTTPLETSSGTGYFSALYRYDMLDSGMPVAHAITRFVRVDFGATSHVVMDDTVIVDSFAVTVFGRSANINATGFAGSHGVILSAVNHDGTAAPEIRGRYLITDFSGSNRFCAFLE